MVLTVTYDRSRTRFMTSVRECETGRDGGYMEFAVSSVCLDKEKKDKCLQIMVMLYVLHLLPLGKFKI